MEREEIEKVRKEFGEIKSNQKDVREKLLELEALKENIYVKRYLELSKMDTDYNRKFSLRSEEELLSRYCSGLNSTKTNGIYFCLGTFTYSNLDIVHGVSDISLDKDDPRASHRKYLNIEDEYDYYEIPIEKCDDFENKHTVIFPKSRYFAYKEYYKIKNEFFGTTILESQDKALEKVLVRKNNLKL